MVPCWTSIQARHSSDHRFFRQSSPRRDFVSLRALHDDGCFTPLRNEPSLSGLDEARLPMARRNAKKLIGDACRQESPAPIRRQYLIPKISMVGASRGPHRTQRFANWYRFGNQTAPHNWKANAFERREHRTLDPGKTAKSEVLRGRRSNLQGLSGTQSLQWRRPSA